MTKHHDSEKNVPDALEAAEKRLKEREEKSTHETSSKEVETLRAKVAELEGLKDQMLRRAADFENAKRRLEREKEEMFNFAHEEVLRALLPIVDNLERALHSAKELNAPEGVRTGLELINKQLLDLLKRFQVHPVQTDQQPFDPHFHEAVGHLESEHPEGTIVGELQKGYLFKNKLLRPAKVQTSSPKKKHS